MRPSAEGRFILSILLILPEKLIVWNGFYFKRTILDRIYRIVGILSPAAMRPSAEGRFILSILLILSDEFFLELEFTPRLLDLTVFTFYYDTGWTKVD
jgi:hypothetical protein